MPKGTGRPNNRGEKMVVAGMKMQQAKGIGRRNNIHPGAEGTPRGAGTYSVSETPAQRKRAESSYKAYASASDMQRTAKKNSMGSTRGSAKPKK